MLCRERPRFLRARKIIGAEYAEYAERERNFKGRFCAWGGAKPLFEGVLQVLRVLRVRQVRQVRQVQCATGHNPSRDLGGPGSDLRGRKGPSREIVVKGVGARGEGGMCQ